MMRAPAGTDNARGEAEPIGPLLRPTGWKRGVAFIAINLAAYAFATICIHYLATGEAASLSIDSYMRSLAQPLSDLLTAPLSVFTHPWMIVILALLVAVLVIVPLLVACLYRLRYCGLFLLCVAVLAQAPLLTMFLAAGCVLVSATKLRSRSPMLAILLGLGPVLVYLYFGSSITIDRARIEFEPRQKILFYAPFILAVVAAVLAAAVVLIIARITRFRPGVIWPVLAMLLGVPVWLFAQHVGIDELDYALLAHRLTAAGTAFTDQTAKDWDQSWPREPTIEQDFAQRKRRVVAQCGAFLRRHPASGHVSEVLWIKGMALDTRINKQALADDVIRYYDDVPLDQADNRQTWRSLAELPDNDVRSAVGKWRLALLALQRGARTVSSEPLQHAVSEAARLLAQAEQSLAIVPKAPLVESRRTGPWGLFTRDEGLPTRAQLLRMREKITALRWCMTANGYSVESGQFADEATARAFCTFVSLDARQLTHAEYNEQLIALAKQFRDTDLWDNIGLAVAMNYDDPMARARALKDLLDRRHADGRLSDASVAAKFELGCLAMQNRKNFRRELDPPQKYFNDVIAYGNNNPWLRLAVENLQALAAKEQVAQ